MYVVRIRMCIRAMQKIQYFGTLKDTHINKEGSKTTFASKCVRIYIHTYRYVHTITVCGKILEWEKIGKL